MCSSSADANPRRRKSGCVRIDFEFALAIAEILERTNPRNCTTAPDCPHRHIRRSEPREVERENSAWRRVGMHAFEVQTDQGARIAAR